jgi:sec-independent protein translocase protein TatA
MLSGWHVFLIVIVLLIFFGPSRLPHLGKSVGEAIRGFKKGLEGDEIDVTSQTKRDSIAPGAADPITQGQTKKEKTDA